MMMMRMKIQQMKKDNFENSYLKKKEKVIKQKLSAMISDQFLEILIRLFFYDDFLRSYLDHRNISYKVNCRCK